MDIKDKFIKVTAEKEDLLKKILILESRGTMLKYFRLNTQYKESNNTNNDIYNQIQEMKQNETVIKYYKFRNKYYYLDAQQKYLYRQIKLQEYKECDHLFVVTYENYRTDEKYRCCVKCGLDERILMITKCYGCDENDLTQEQKIMADYMKHNYYDSAYFSDIHCDYELAKAIYEKIKAKHPGIDNITADHYLKNALEYMRNTKVNNDRKQSRIERLLLRPDFDSWSYNDTVDDRSGSLAGKTLLYLKKDTFWTL